MVRQIELVQVSLGQVQVDVVSKCFGCTARHLLVVVRPGASKTALGCLVVMAVGWLRLFYLATVPVPRPSHVRRWATAAGVYTLDVLGRVAVEDAWRRLRSMRHKPPRSARSGQRRLVFAAAIKQAEQLLKASDAVGYETKPILQFYGLSQAARAISAAFAKGQPWELSGHGITCPNLDQKVGLGEILVVDQGNMGSFGALAKLLESASLPEAVTLRELWMALPEGSEVPIEGTRDTWGAIRLERWGRESYWDYFDSGTHAARARRLPLWLAPMTVEQVQSLLAKRYPSLKYFRPARRYEDGSLSYGWTPGVDRLILDLSFDNPIDDELRSRVGPQIILCGALEYSDTNSISTFVIPTLRNSQVPMKPLLLWWSTLFTLSMLARYYPSSWARMLDVDASADAAALEYILTEAHASCLNSIIEVFEFDELTQGNSIPPEVQKAMRQRGILR